MYRLIEYCGEEFGLGTGSRKYCQVLLSSRVIAWFVLESDQLRLTERYRLTSGGKTLANEIFEDLQTFSRPGRTRVTYKCMPCGAEI